MEKMGKQCSEKLNPCAKYAHICKYKCCDQSREKGERIKHNNAILLYPGEYEAAKKYRKHILVLKEFNRGKLRYCDRANFDQSKCSDRANFKPLDCKSYPFFPAIIEGKLILLKDSGCPISVTSEDLRRHHNEALSLWKSLVEKRPDITEWIKSLRLDGYVRYDLSQL